MEGKRITIQELANAVQNEAIERGFAHIDPSPEVIRINSNSRKGSVDFTVYDERGFSTRWSCLVNEMDIDTQELTVTSYLKFLE